MAVLRLDKLLADQGLASRKDLREMIRSGRVTVDGAVCRKPEQKVDPERQTVGVDGRTLVCSRHHYYMMDKPEGVLTAVEDAGQRTVLDLLPAELRRQGISPVGRLDKDTSGLLLLTDDGEFAHRLLSPRYEVEKRYLAHVDGDVDGTDVQAFADGLVLRDGTRCLPAALEPVGTGTCLVTVTEGKYHQVKRMLASRGKPVLSLRRLSVGPLQLDDSLGPGGWKELDGEDLCKLFRTVFGEN